MFLAGRSNPSGLVRSFLGSQVIAILKELEDLALERCLVYLVWVVVQDQAYMYNQRPFSGSKIGLNTL